MGLEILKTSQLWPRSRSFVLANSRWCSAIFRGKEIRNITSSSKKNSHLTSFVFQMSTDSLPASNSLQEEREARTLDAIFLSTRRKARNYCASTAHLTSAQSRTGTSFVPRSFSVSKILYRNSEKGSLNAKKMASRNIFQHFFCMNFFMFVLLISNFPTVFLVQFGINLYL